MGGRHSTEVAFVLSTQQFRVRFLVFPNLLNVAEICRQQHCLDRVDSAKA